MVADIVGRPDFGSLATIIAHRTYNAGETPGTCGEGTGGSIDLSPGAWLEGHPDTGSPPIVAVADGDISIPTSDLVGLVAAGETFDGNGPGTTNLEGAVVVSDRCDEGLHLNGDITITYTGPFMTLFEATATTTTSENFDITLRSEV